MGPWLIRLTLLFPSFLFFMSWSTRACADVTLSAVPSFDRGMQQPSQLPFPFFPPSSSLVQRDKFPLGESCLREDFKLGVRFLFSPPPLFFSFFSSLPPTSARAGANRSLRLYLTSGASTSAHADLSAARLSFQLCSPFFFFFFPFFLAGGAPASACEPATHPHPNLLAQRSKP